MDLQTVLNAVERWPTEDRVRLIDEIRSGLENVPETLTLTDAQKQDLQRRLDARQDDPKRGSPWEEVKARIQERKS